MSNRYDVALIVPPVTDGSMPSLAMSLLKACLSARGIKSYVDYADMHFYANIGAAHALAFQQTYKLADMGEVMFLPLTGYKPKKSREEYLSWISKFRDWWTVYDLPTVLGLVEAAAAKTVDETVRTIIESGARLVGLVTQFQQINAAIAIMQRVKALKPEIVTMVGGAHCMDTGGLTMLRHWDFVDYVFCGEADEIFGEVCEKILAGEKDFPLPYGVLRRGEPIPDEPPHRRTQDLNKLPYPEYDDYFALPEKYPAFYEKDIFASQQALVLEGSRGCWWGEKGPCTFCGLNGRVRVYREKDPERFADEICFIAEKWPKLKFVNFSDSIMSVRHTKELPALLLKNLPRKIAFQTEIKSNLSEEDMIRISNCGIRSIQPGIENLHDDILTLMHKGNTGLDHIALLRYGKKLHMNMIWNLLYKFPGEPAAAYEELEKLLPLVFHLQPANAFAPVQYHRSSVYCNNPEKYGLVLEPGYSYAYSMPDDDDYVRGLAYMFDNHAPEANPPVYERVGLLMAEWLRQWNSGHKETLEMELFDDRVEIRDTRLCSTSLYHTLKGVSNGVYRRANAPVRRASLVKEFGPEADEAIDDLIARKLMVEMNGRVVALAVETTWKSKKEAPWLRYAKVPVGGQYPKEDEAETGN